MLKNVLAVIVNARKKFYYKELSISEIDDNEEIGEYKMQDTLRSMEESLWT